MLVLTRKQEEKIVIGNELNDSDKIVITILKVQGGKVSIGIQADKKWQIVRKELLDCCDDEEQSHSKEENAEESKTCKQEEPMVLVGASTEQ